MDQKINWNQSDAPILCLKIFYTVKGGLKPKVTVKSAASTSICRALKAGGVQQFAFRQLPQVAKTTKRLTQSFCRSHLAIRNTRDNSKMPHFPTNSTSWSELPSHYSPIADREWRKVWIESEEKCEINNIDFFYVVACS